MFFGLNYVHLCHRPTRMFMARIIGVVTSPSVVFVADQWNTKFHTAGPGQPVSHCKTNKFKYCSSAKHSAPQMAMFWHGNHGSHSKTVQVEKKKKVVERNLSF